MKDRKTAFISGNFNIVHPGHVRLFAFAKKLAQRLIVGVHSDELGGEHIHISQDLRLEALKSNSWIDEVVLIKGDITKTIQELKPDIIVKGKEFENRVNPEADAVATYGGRLIFGSAEVSLSSLELLSRDLPTLPGSAFTIPQNYIQQHQIERSSLLDLAKDFSGLRVCVIGDLVIDEYITCDALGMSQEDPTLVVSPIDQRRFVGGAGIVAAHASALGAKPTLISVCGKDEVGGFARATLDTFGVNSILIVDESRPTTLKQRFRAENKSLLRVSHLRQSSISLSHQIELIEQAKTIIQNSDLLVFSDFNYGCLPQPVVDRCTEFAKNNRVIRIADSQSSSQVGDVSRFRDMTLISATEREVRISLRDKDDGLPVIAEKLRAQTEASHIFLKLGADGVLLHMPSKDNILTTDRLPAFNASPIDVAGAGDSMLITAGLTLAAGGSPWESALVGNLAAALQVAKVGNIPISYEELSSALSALAI